MPRDTTNAAPTVGRIERLRRALLDNAAGHPLATVHRDDLLALLDEVQPVVKFWPDVAAAEPEPEPVTEPMPAPEVEPAAPEVTAEPVPQPADA